MIVNDQQLVDRLRGICTAVDQTLTPEMREWAQQYADARQAANDRLRRCADLLHRGLRGEAIALADAQPALLDTVAALDFSELPQWENLCAGYGLPRVPALQIEVAQELNEAYALQEPLREPLRLYRLMALMRAPLADRILVARDLARLDPLGSPFAEDVGILERARQRELHGILQKAIADPSTSADRLFGLRYEVSSADWQTPCDPTWATAAELAARVRSRQAGCVRLEAMLPDFEEAHGAMDYDRSRALLVAWDGVCAEHYLAEVPVALLDRAMPLADWVQQETQRRAHAAQFDTAVAAYAAALDNNGPDADLHRHVDTLGRFGLEVPETLTRRHRQLVAERHTADQRRRRRNTFAAAALVLAVAGVAAAGGHQLYRNQQARAYAARIRSAVDAGRLDDGQAAAKEAESAGFASQPDVAAVTSTLASAQNSERQRQASFDGELQHIATLLDANALQDINFAAATRLGVTDDQKLRLGSLQDRYDKALRQERDALRVRARPLLERAAALGREMEDPALPDDVFAVRQSEAVTLAASLRDIALRLPEIAPSAKAVTDRLDQGPRDRSSRNARADAMNACVRAADAARSDPAAFVTALNTAADAYRGDAREVLLRDVAKRNAAAWQAAAEWFRVAGALREVLTADTSARLDVASHAVDQYTAAYPASPTVDMAAALKSRLQGALATAGQGATWPVNLRHVLTSRPMNDWLVVRLTDGNLFVTDAKAFRPRGSGATVKWIRAETNDPDEPSVETRVLAATDLLPDGGSVPAKAPQARMSQAMLKILDATTLPTWDALDGELIGQIVAAKDADPLLRASLLQQLLQRDAALGPAGSAEAAPAHFLDALNELKVGDLNWIDPTDPAAAAARTRCVALLSSPEAQSLAGQLQTVARRRRDAAAAAVADCVGCGVVLYDDQGKATVRTAQPLRAACTAWATHWAPDGTVRLVPIGASGAGGDVKLDPAAGEPADGTLVFFTQTPAPADGPPTSSPVAGRAS